MKVAGLLGENFDFSIPLGIQIEIDFYPTNLQYRICNRTIVKERPHFMHKRMGLCAGHLIKGSSFVSSTEETYFRRGIFREGGGGVFLEFYGALAKLTEKDNVT